MAERIAIGHRRADLARVISIGLGSADVFNSSLLVNNSDLSNLSVHLEEDLTLSSVLGQRANSKKLENQDLALLKFNVELLANLGTRQEVSSGQHGKITVLLDKLLIVLKYLGTLKELQNGTGEIELRSLRLDIFGGKTIGDHELSKITNNLGSWGNLDDVTEKLVGMLIGLLGLEPLGSKTQLRRLKHHVGQLTTRNLVLVHLRIGASKVGLEGGVEQTKLLPVHVKSSDKLGVQSRVTLASLKGSNDSIDAGLRSHSRQTVGGGINSISASLCAGNHRGNTSTGRVMGMNVDGEIRYTSHVLDTQDINVKSDKLVDESKVVLEVILLARAKHCPNNSPSFLHRFDTDFELINIVKSIEDTEDVDTVLLSLVNEVINGVVRNKLSHLAKSVPRILIEESHSNIESGASPALKRVEVGKSMAGLFGDAKQVDCTNTSSQNFGKSLGSLLEDDVSPSLGARLGGINLLSGRVDELGNLDLALELGLTDLALDAAAVDGNVT
ncbi:hypothetical protein HG531_011930 [Fusarium graminearum]|nr:hypothetical protein HG531_011930 [Fusarium graminearum]